MEYQLDNWRGKTCFIFLLIANALLYYTSGLLAVMYITTLNSKLRRDLQVGMLERMDIKWLQILAIPWPILIATFLGVILLLAEVPKSMTHFLRGMYGICIFYPLFPTICIHLYYFYKVAQFLQNLVTDLDGVPSHNNIKQIKILIWRSKVIGLYDFYIGLVGGCLVLSAVFKDYLHDPRAYLGFQTFISAAIQTFFSLYFLVLGISESDGSKNSENNSSKNASFRNQSKTVSTGSKTAAVQVVSTVEGTTGISGSTNFEYRLNPNEEEEV
uniref:Uncharacterized protein n=1 Tax=Aplanochytrium stocchinoi TaxID=215587 RepID=A0A7S3V2T6_9STRA